MKTLGLIITGQLRTFFDDEVQMSFRNFLKGLSTEYKVYAALVVNQSSVQPEQFEFLKDYIYEYSLLEYPKYHKEFEKRKEIYSNLFTIHTRLGIDEDTIHVSDEYCYLDSFYYQASQIQVGILALKKYGITFDCIMRTRFDVIYKIDILPFSNPGNVLVPHSVEQEYSRNLQLKRSGFKDVNDYLNWANTSEWQSLLRFENIEDYLKWAKTPECESLIQIHKLAALLGFGGRYYNNTDILNKSNYIWMYNDHIIIGTEPQFDTFLHVWDLFCNIDRLEQTIFNSKIAFLFAPESLFILHCIGHEMTPIMYLDDTWDLKR